MPSDCPLGPTTGTPNRSLPRMPGSWDPIDEVVPDAVLVLVHPELLPAARHLDVRPDVGDELGTDPAWLVVTAPGEGVRPEHQPLAEHTTEPRAEGLRSGEQRHD